MAHVKSAGAAKQGEDSRSQQLGVKLFDGQKAKAGCVLVRQRGAKYYSGKNVRRGKDDTLYASKNGLVKFSSKQHLSFDKKKKRVVVINVI